MPLAYFIMNELVLPTKQSELYIDESYSLLVASLEADDIEYESLDELLAATSEE